MKYASWLIFFFQKKKLLYLNENSDPTIHLSVMFGNFEEKYYFDKGLKFCKISNKVELAENFSSESEMAKNIFLECFSNHKNQILILGHLYFRHFQFNYIRSHILIFLMMIFYQKVTKLVEMSLRVYIFLFDVFFLMKHSQMIPKLLK